jgi:hypothetical protein
MAGEAEAPYNNILQFRHIGHVALNIGIKRYSIAINLES